MVRSEGTWAENAEFLNSLNHDFNSLTKDFKHLKRSMDYGRDLNRAFQRLIYLLSDQNRLQVLA